MPMFVKISQRTKGKLPMVTPGTRDADIMPSSGSSMGSGLTLDYRAIQVGDNSQLSYADDNELKAVKAPDFAETGTYLVETSQGTKKIYRDPESREWYEEHPSKHYSQSWLGSTKQEALDRLEQFYNDAVVAVSEADDDEELEKYLAGELTSNWWAADHRIKFANKLWEKATALLWPWIDKVQLSRIKQNDDGSWQEVHKIVDINDELVLLPLATHAADDFFSSGYSNEHYNNAYGDDLSPRGSFVGSKDDGFPLRHSLAAKKLTAVIIKGNPKFLDNKLAKDFYNDIKTYLEDKGYEVSFDDGKAYTTPKKADLWIGHSKGVDRLSHYDKDDIKLLAIGALREKNDNPNVVFVNHPKDEEYLRACLQRKKYDTPIDEHFMFTDAMKKAIDKITKGLIKTAFPDYPQYSDPAMYTQVMESPMANTTPLFDIFNTYFVDDDEIEVEEDDEDKVETQEQVTKKEAFIKKAVTYDSNSIIQGLVKIPEIKALLDQQASGYVDSIIVTTPSADITQTQQQLKQPDGKPTALQPISGNPYGHVWISEDPKTHQKKPLDKIVRIDRVTDAWGTLGTILHEIAHHRHPDWSDGQVESEAQRNADSVKQFLNTASKKILFVKSNLRSLPIIECEHADTYQKQVIGLQDYKTLNPKSGMLFSYKKPQSLSFWMGKVAFPIDIIFANANNQILKIYRNCFPNSSDIYSCDNASKVIEVVGSFCAFHDLDVGDQVFEADDEPYKQEDFAKYILQKLKDIKLEQQEQLEMMDWNIKIVMKHEPDSRRFLRVTWTPEDYQFKKADILVNPDPLLISKALKKMPLDKLMRHALLHILAGAKNELPEEEEQELITSKLFKEATIK